jgi:lipoprotein NlpI
VKRSLTFLVLLAANLFAGAALFASSPDESRAKAMEAWKAGEFDKAIQEVTEGLGANPRNERLVHLRAQMHAMRHEDKAALADFNTLEALAPDSGMVRQERARIYFRMGRFSDAAGDFDAANRLGPQFAPYNWERGIALYFSGRYREARDQFELHQTVNTNDVENAVWHFMCVTRLEDIGAARRKFIPIAGDERVPMRDIRRLFAGLATVDDVLKAANDAPAKEGQSPEDARDQRAFHAHLYCGLYLELTGKPEEAKAHYAKAAALTASEEFMAVVARIAALKGSVAPAPAPTESEPPSDKTSHAK